MPQTKTEELINELNQLIGSGKKDNEILIRRISKQSDDLLKIDPCEAYLVKGILASFKDLPFAEISAFFEKALKLNSSSCLAHLNYSIAYSYAGRYSKELEHMEKARKFASGVREVETVARTYPNALLSSYKFFEFAELTGENNIAEFMRSHDLSEEDLSLVCSAVEKIHSLIETKYYSPNIRMFPQDDTLSIEYPVDGGFAVANALTDKLYDELLDLELPDKVLKVVSVGYICS